MKKIYQLILKSYIGPFVVTFFIAVFILIMQFLWKWIDEFIGKGLDWAVIAEILFYASATVVPMALPLAVLLASVMTFGNFGEHYELSAMKSAGMSLPKIMQPLIFFTLLVSIGAFFFSNYALPYTNLKMTRILYDVQRKNPELNIKTGIFNNDIKGYSIKIDSRSKEGMMYDFMIYNHTKNKGNKEVTVADSGTMRISENRKFLVFTLYNGHSYIEADETKKRTVTISKQNQPSLQKNVIRNTNNNKTKQYNHRHDSFSQEEVIFRLDDNELKNSSESLWKNNYQMKNIYQLSNAIDSLTIAYGKKQKQLKQRLMKYNYLKNEYRTLNIRDSLKKINDSIQKYKKPEELYADINTDSIFDKMSNKNKVITIEQIIKDTRRIRNDLETTEKVSRDRLRWLRKHELSWYRKFSLSFSCLIFFFIGAPLGAIIRKGGFGMPFLVSIVLFMAYYVITITGEKFVKEGVLPVLIGSWLSSSVLFPLGVFITYKASRDSSLLDIATFRKVVDKIISFVRKE